MQTRHPAPPYVRNHHRHTDHTGELNPFFIQYVVLLNGYVSRDHGEGRGVHFSRSTFFFFKLALDARETGMHEETL